MKKSVFENLFEGLLGKKDKKAHWEKEIVKLAQRRGGRLSILDIVAETSLNSTDADELMAEMNRNGHVTMDVTESGGIMYIFPGMAERFKLDNQELFRQEITRETPPPAPSPAPRRSEPPPRRDVSPPQPRRDASPPRPEKKPPDFPLPPPKPKVLQRVETQGLIFEVQSCTRVEKNVVCELLVRTPQRQKELGIRPGAKVFDEFAKEYLAQVQVMASQQRKASADAKNYIDYVWVSVAVESAVKIKLSFRLPSPQPRIIPLLELQCKNDMFGSVFTVQFQDLPISS